MKKRILTLMSIILVSFLMVGNVYAANKVVDTQQPTSTPVLTTGSEDILAPSNDEVSEKAFDADADLEVTGIFNTTRFVAGNTVNNKATIDGLSFAAANTLNARETAPYGFYAGNIITIEANIEKDLFVAGNSITIGSSAMIGRDLYVAGSVVKINTNIGRNLNVGASSVDLSGITINGNAFVGAENITLDKDTVIMGTLTYYDDAKITGLDVATVTKSEKRKAADFDFDVNISFGDRVYSLLISAVAAFIVIVVLFYMLPNSKKSLEEEKMEVGTILGTIGKGFLTLILVPFISIITMITGILTPLSLIGIGVYIVGIYLSSLLTGYIIGHIITSKVIKSDNQYLALVIGIVIIKVVGFIPYIGGLITALALFYGMGLIFKALVSKK